MQIVIVEEDPHLAAFMARALESEKYEVETFGAWNGQVAPGTELVVLDVSMRTEEGIRIVEGVRNRCSGAGILALISRRPNSELVQLLDAGVDDCVTKPFTYAELSARIRALIRRRRSSSSSVLQVGDLVMDRVQRQVERGGRRIGLTTTEYSLLEFLMRNSGRRMSRSEILEHVWKTSPGYGSTNIVDVYIAYLRKKIDGGSPAKLIRTLRGVGYEISGHSDQATARPEDRAQVSVIQRSGQ